MPIFDQMKLYLNYVASILVLVEFYTIPQNKIIIVKRKKKREGKRGFQIYYPSLYKYF